MKHSIFFSALIISILFSCKKEEVIDLSAVCEKGDMWMVDKKDTFPPNHAMDTFKFLQGAGYHKLEWRYSFANKLTLGLKSIPDAGRTTVYKKIYIDNISLQYRGDDYVLNSSDFKDSMFQLTNYGTHYTFKANEIVFKTFGKPDLILRVCDLKMTDMIP